METTEEEEEEATEAVAAAPESPGQIFLSHTSLDYPHDDPVKRHIIEEVWPPFPQKKTSIKYDCNSCHKVYLTYFFLESSFLLG